jgi:uncharacterized protein (DUF2141 family)
MLSRDAASRVGPWLLGLSLGAVAAIPSSQAAETPGTIALSVSAFDNDRGKLLIVLYDQEDGFPTKPEKAARRLAAAIAEKKVELEIPGLHPGQYALSVVHDENGNGRLDSNLIGIPKEPVGVSNNAKGSFGPPKWKDAKFTVPAGSRVVQKIALRRI